MSSLSSVILWRAIFNDDFATAFQLQGLVEESLNNKFVIGLRKTPGIAS
jgi:hypothetical protein